MKYTEQWWLLDWLTGNVIHYIKDARRLQDSTSMVSVLRMKGWMVGCHVLEYTLTTYDCTRYC